MKKGYIKTIEVMVSILIVVVFTTYIIPQYTSSPDSKDSLAILIHLEKLSGFREFVSAKNGCYNSSQDERINQFINQYLPSDYNYYVCINDKPSELPGKKINTDSLFMTGNITKYVLKNVKLYYWVR